MATQLALIENALSIEQVISQRTLVMSLMKDAMTLDLHYGKIPGCGTKPSLFQAGAQLMACTFRLAPTYEVTTTQLPNGHREYSVICRMTHGGIPIAEGVGLCSSMESKFRYRNVASFTVTDEPIPKDAKEKKDDYRKQGFGMKQVEGVWKWVKYGDNARSENPDIADTFNAVLKIAKKRAFVDATITATACNDLFTQDLEDIRENLEAMGVHSEVVKTEKSDTHENAGEKSDPPQIVWEGIIVDVREKTGTTKGKDWKFYIVKMENGNEACTFSDTIAGQAKAFGESGDNALVMVKPGRKANSWEVVSVANAPHKQP